MSAKYIFSWISTGVLKHNRQNYFLWSYILTFWIISRDQISPGTRHVYMWSKHWFNTHWVKVDGHRERVLFSPGWFQCVHNDWKLQILRCFWSSAHQQNIKQRNRDPPQCCLSSHILAVSYWVQNIPAWPKTKSWILQHFISMRRSALNCLSLQIK